MFSDLSNQGGPERFQQSSNLKEIEGHTDFKCVSVQKFRIKRLSEGIFEYIPVTFDEQHFCVALCTIHSSLLDFRFRSRELKPFSRSEYLKLQEQERKAQEGGGGKALPDDKGKRVLKDKNEKAKPEDWKPSNIAEYLFSNDRGEIADDIDAKEID